MSYNPLTDFLGLLRLNAGVASAERMPGLDWAVAALARAGLITLSVGQTPPLVDQPTTVWFKPSVPSWVAEGTVFLWNAAMGAYQPATPALWNMLLAPSGYFFQSVSGASNVISSGVTILAIQRTAPLSTALVLPSLASQWASGRPLKIVDWSTTVTNHLISITSPDGASIMRQGTWQLLSTADQLAGVTLHASPDLNGWVIAP